MSEISAYSEIEAGKSLRVCLKKPSDGNNKENKNVKLPELFGYVLAVFKKMSLGLSVW